MRLAQFVVSRFNLVQPLGAVRPYERPGGYDGWCARRRDLFFRYTLPSVLAQDTDGFSWLIWFRPEINEPIQEVLDAIAPHPHVEAVFLDTALQPPEHFEASLRAETVARAEGADLVCTTRLDTDDCLHTGFVRSIRSAARRLPPASIRPRHFLNPPYGAQLLDGRYYAMVRPGSNVMSVVERSDAVRTPMAFPHWNAHEHGPVTQIRSDEPLWLMVLHDENAANELADGALELVGTPRLPEMFGIASAG